MDRTEALDYLNSSGLGAVMSSAGRTLDDEVGGYGPALDRAFSLYIKVNSLDTTVADTTVSATDTYGFQIVLMATSYDLVLPNFALLVDSSVDAPLANLKLSQQYRQLKDLADRYWAIAAEYGYGDFANVGGFDVNLDFKEPGNTNGGGFG